MMKIETTAPLLQYEQPTSKEFKVRARRMICASPEDYGDTGYAGNGYNNDNTTEYGEDF